MAASLRTCNDEPDEITSGLTVPTMLTIFFVPALCGAWIKVRRQAQTTTDTAPVFSEPIPAT